GRGGWCFSLELPLAWWFPPEIFWVMLSVITSTRDCAGLREQHPYALPKARITQAKSSKSLSDARRSRLGTPRSRGQGPGAPAYPGSRRAQRLLSLRWLSAHAAPRAAKR